MVKVVSNDFQRLILCKVH